MKARSPRRLALEKTLFILLLVVVAVIIVFAAIQKTDWTVPEQAKQRKNPLQPSSAALQSAREIYATKCAHCHGDSGKGDGREAARYDPAPSDLTDARRMNAITDGEIFYKISQGRRPMPAFKRRLSEGQRWQLVLLLRSFSRPLASPVVSGAPSTPQGTSPGITDPTSRAPSR